MLTFTLRRLLLAIPTLLVISLVIFLLVDLAPGSPLSEIPLTVPPDVRQKMIEAMGADQPVFVRYVLWLRQFFWVEPATLFDSWFGTSLAAGEQRILSWQTRSPVFTMIGQRIPQTITVVGTAYLLGVMIALPIGIYSAYRQYSWFERSAGQCGCDQPLHAIIDAGQHGAGLRAHGARKGDGRTHGRAEACAAQFADPGGHGHRTGHSGNFRRGDHHRKPVRCERHRLCPDPCHPGQ
jgi:hypothetical protein